MRPDKFVPLRDLFKELAESVEPAEPGDVLLLLHRPHRGDQFRILFTDFTFHTVEGAGLRSSSTLRLEAVSRERYEERLRAEFGAELERFLDREEPWVEVGEEDWERGWAEEVLADRESRSRKVTMADDAADIETRKRREKREEIEKNLKQAQKMAEIKRKREKKEKDKITITGSKEDAGAGTSRFPGGGFQARMEAKKIERERLG